MSALSPKADMLIVDIVSAKCQQLTLRRTVAPRPRGLAAKLYGEWQDEYITGGPSRLNQLMAERQQIEERMFYWEDLEDE